MAADQGQVEVHIGGAEQPKADNAPQSADAPSSAPAASAAPAASNPAAADKANKGITENKHAQAASGFLSPGFQEPFFGCFSDIKGTALSCCCPCIVAAANEANVADRPVTYVDCLACCPSPYTTTQTMRKKYGMAYAPFNDCFAACCCRCCALHQTTREIAVRSGKAPEFMKMI